MLIFTARFLRPMFAAVITTSTTAHVVAQPYPAKPIRLIIPAGPGGGVDTIARVVGQSLSRLLRQPVVMDNRAGAGTMLASELTAKAPPDGYTLLMITNSHAINAGLHSNMSYDPVNDFSFISSVASVPYLVVVHPSVAAASVRELIALARRQPGSLYFASAGSGSGTHLAAELFRSMAKLNMVHVPYKGGSAAIVDLVGGHVQLMFSNMINSGPQVKTHRLRALAITTPKRFAIFPDVPTVAESGLPGYAADVWYGLAAPARTPAEIIARLNRENTAALKTIEVREKLAAQGASVAATTPDEMTALMRSEIVKWGKITANLDLRGD